MAIDSDVTFLKLHGAVQCDLEYGAHLLEEYPHLLEQEDEYGGTPLGWAAGFNSMDGVNLLLRAGAKVNPRPTVHGQTPLSAAAQQGHKQAMALLLAANADIDGKDGQGEVSPLLMAASNSRVPCVRLLLEAGANVEASNCLGFTAMALACILGDIRVAQLLSSFGAQRCFRLYQDRPVYDGKLTPTAVGTVTFPLSPDEVADVDLVELLERPDVAHANSVGAAAADCNTSNNVAGSGPNAPVFITAAELATAKGHTDLARWLAQSCGWQRLHHLGPLAETDWQIKQLSHMPAYRALLRHLTATRVVAKLCELEGLVLPRELPPLALLKSALDSVPDEKDEVLAQYADSSDLDRPTNLVDMMPSTFAPALEPDSLHRRKQVVIAKLELMCFDFFNEFAPGPMLSDEAAAERLWAGDDIHTRAEDGTTPLSMAQAMGAAKAVIPGSAADKVLDALLSC